MAAPPQLTGDMVALNPQPSELEVHSLTLQPAEALALTREERVLLYADD